MNNMQFLQNHRRHQRNLLNLLIGAIGLITAVSSHSAPLASNEIKPPEAPWYDVEIIVFATENGSRRNEEDWPNPDDLDLTVPKEFVQFKHALFDQAVTVIETGDEFVGLQSKLVRRNGSRILFKRSWQQRIYNDRMTVPWYVKGGQQNEGLNEFEGYIKISVRRYLHIDLDLRLHRIGVPVKASSLPSELQHLQTQSTLGGLPENLTGAFPTTNQAASSVQILETIQLKQKRRMRSKEIHYIDHPLMGVLVRISPMQTGGINSEINPG